jgi:alkylation response protein AidB-like acyl-CoA dehydrogenase
MDFTFTDEQRMMAGALRELLDDVCTPGEVRAAAGHDADAQRTARWRRLREMGLTGVLAPEIAGGLGLRDIDFVLLAEEAGRCALPEMLIDHAAIAVPLLASLANDQRAADALREAASGDARIAVSHPINPFAMAVQDADLILLPDGEDVHLAPRQQVTLAARESLDPVRPLSVLSFAPSGQTCIASGAVARGAWGATRERGALYAAAEMLGLTARLIEIAVDYSAQRQQFGKTIGSNQAVKHHLANAQVKLEFARPVVYAAAALIDSESDDARMRVSHAKLAASDAADFAARTAMQVHGAMGYSWEVDLHFYMKRAWLLAGWYGDRNFHMRRIQAKLFSDSFPVGPEFTFDRVQAHG